ncbi:MAG: sugar phosphate nucleotidyltransferase, partial [Defluviitaleaceae bacterium]|nr:sugar phosphate nucleotidyltransferase [Defluviitaleaceae bacterium]
RYYFHFGFSDFIVCCGYKGYMIKEYFADYLLHNSDITFDFSTGAGMQSLKNSAEPWRVTLVHTGLNTQTGGRIKRVAEYINGQRFLLTYGDGVSDIDLDAVIKQHAETKSIVTISAIQPVGRFGVLDIEGNIVKQFQEKPKGEGGWINGGFMVAEPELLDYIDGDDTMLEVGPLQKLSAQGKLGVYKHYGFWQCMDTQRDKYNLEQQWKSGDAKWKI